MNRRSFLGVVGVAAAATLQRAAAALPFGREPPFGRDAICRSRAVSAVAATEPGRDGLVYEGTHILTYGAMREIALRYRGGRLVVHGGGCDNAVFGVRQGSSDLGGMCCPPAGPRFEGLKSLLVARDIKVVVAHPDSRCDAVSLDALRRVVAGVIDDWHELGAAPGPIALVVREHCAGYAEAVRTTLLGGEPAWSRRALFFNTDEQVVDAASRFPRALGIASWVFAKPLVEAGRLALLTVEGAAPIAEAVASGHYPLVAPLSIIYRRWRPEMRPLFDFIYGPEGRAVIAERLVPVSAAEAGYS